MRTRVIDKLELRIEGRKHRGRPFPGQCSNAPFLAEAGVPFTREFAREYLKIRNDETLNPFRPSRYYLLVGDLRPFGYEAILHLWSKRGRDATHKIELVDTGGRTLAGMLREIEDIFDVDATRAEVTRIDLAADVENISVSWFHDRVRAKWKRWHAQMGQIEISWMGKGEIQTLYYGKRPNVYRIYDKLAEYRHQHERLIRKISRDAEVPPIEEAFPIPPNVNFLTRVERQIAGGRVPLQLATISAIRRHAAEFKPFDRLELMGKGRAEPRQQDYDFDTYCAGMYLRQMQETRGMQWTRQFIARGSNGQAARTLRRFADFLPADLPDEPLISEGRLKEIYWASVSKQITA